MRIFMTGFEAGHTGIWDASSYVTVVDTQARTGTYSMYSGGNDDHHGQHNLSSGPTEIYIRWGMRPGVFTLYTAEPVRLYDSAGPAQLTVTINKTTRALEVRRGNSSGTLLGSGGLASQDIWTCIEMRVLVDNSSGIVQVRQDGAAIIDYSGDTQATANADLGRIDVGRGMRGYYDDIAINDTSGSRNNSWIGRGGIVLGEVAGAGTHTDFTPSAGANYECVDEIPPNDDTDYVESDTVGHQDTYALQALPVAAGEISAVQWIARAKLDAAGSGNFQRLLRHDGVDYNGGDLAVDVSYQYFTEIFDEAPDGSEWSIAKVNALEIGMEVS